MPNERRVTECLSRQLLVAVGLGRKKCGGLGIGGPQNNIRWDVSWVLNKVSVYANEISAESRDQQRVKPLFRLNPDENSMGKSSPGL